MNEEFELYVFNVWAWQSIFFHPIGFEQYNMLIDVWIQKNPPLFQERHPIDYLLVNDKMSRCKNWCPYLWDLTITNYDNDHFCGLPYLKDRVFIRTACLNNNISPETLGKSKPEKTKQLEELIKLKSEYTNYNIEWWDPPYDKYVYKPTIPSDWNWDFNDLSQLVFIQYWWVTVCVPWDLEQKWWNEVLQDSDVQNRLSKTNIFFASHHWRENWYVKEVFDYCCPNIIIVSDKEIMYKTQEDCSSVYGKHVNWWLFCFWENVKRKVLSTRNDWSFVFSWNAQDIHINKFNF